MREHARTQSLLRLAGSRRSGECQADAHDVSSGSSEDCPLGGVAGQVVERSTAGAATQEVGPQPLVIEALVRFRDDVRALAASSAPAVKVRAGLAGVRRAGVGSRRDATACRASAQSAAMPMGCLCAARHRAGGSASCRRKSVMSGRRGTRSSASQQCAARASCSRRIVTHVEDAEARSCGHPEHWPEAERALFGAWWASMGLSLKGAAHLLDRHHVGGAIFGTVGAASRLSRRNGSCCARWSPLTWTTSLGSLATRR